MPLLLLHQISCCNCKYLYVFLFLFPPIPMVLGLYPGFVLNLGIMGIEPMSAHARQAPCLLSHLSSPYPMFVILLLEKMLRRGNSCLTSSIILSALQLKLCLWHGLIFFSDAFTSRSQLK